MIVTIFVGVNITTWTSWVWWTLGIEILLIWVYTVRVPFSYIHVRVLTRSFVVGYLLRHQAWLVPYTYLRKRPLSVPLSILLVRVILYGSSGALAATPLQGVQVHLRPVGH